jgi:hypothetical protein
MGANARSRFFTGLPPASVAASDAKGKRMKV